MGRGISTITIALTSPNSSLNAEESLADPVKHLPPHTPRCSLCPYLCSTRQNRGGISSCRNRGCGLMFAERIPTRLHASAAIAFQIQYKLISQQQGQLKGLQTIKYACRHTNLFFLIMPSCKQSWNPMILRDNKFPCSGYGSVNMANRTVTSLTQY